MNIYIILNKDYKLVFHKRRELNIKKRMQKLLVANELLVS